MNNSGTERIVSFFFEGSFIVNGKEKSSPLCDKFFIQALTDVDILILNDAPCDSLYISRVALENLELKIQMLYYNELLTHNYLLGLKTPIERYRHISVYNPNVVQQLSLIEMAKYLHISREALTRARIRLLKAPC